MRFQDFSFSSSELPNSSRIAYVFRTINAVSVAAYTAENPAPFLKYFCDLRYKVKKTLVREGESN